MNQDFRRFIGKLLLFGSPVLLILLTYVYFDPFEVLRTYDAYPTNYGKTVNRNRISTQQFLNGKDTYHYQSFILGSSRSSVFYATEWGKHINDKYAFHFDASNEIIGGIANKLAFIEEQKQPIKNALILLDAGNFEYATDTAGTIFIQDYRVAKNIKPWQYQLVFLSSYFKDAYFVKYLDFKLFNTFRTYMNKALENREITYTPIHNDFIFTSYLKDIARDSVAYYQRDYFYQRDTTKQQVYAPVIRDFQEDYLAQMAEIFKRNNTNYQLVISPSFDQKKFHPTDIQILEKYFDKNRIHDYSGINRFTNHWGNYYEIFHFKPHVANEIMQEIYKK